MKILGQYLVWIIVGTLIVLLLLPTGITAIEKQFYPIRYEEHVLQSSQQHGVPRNLILAIMREESHFQSTSVSTASAVGLMQLMPGTARWIASKRDIPFDLATLTDPKINIDLGVWYLSYLLRTLKSETLAIEAYNAGITNVARWEHSSPGSILFKETEHFVRRVERSRMVYDRLYGEKWEKR